MVVEVVVPPAGESIKEGMLVEWSQPDGSLVRAEEPLFILETDKVTLTVNAPQSGRLAVKVAAGEMVKIGQVVASLDTSAAAEAEAARPASAPLPPAPPVIAPAPPPAPAPAPVTKSAAPSPPINPPAGFPQMRARVEGKALDDLSPSVRRLVAEHGLDPARIAATGKDGRLTKEDVLAHLQNPPPTTADGRRPTAAPPAAASGDRTVRKPMSPIRQRIAERMLVSQQSTATLTTFNEADLSALLELRKKYREAFKAKHHVDLGFLPFFVKAVVEGLQAAPSLRSTLEGAELVRHDYFDIGIAVAAEHGLAVPVVRDADRKSLAEIQDDIETLARKVREKSITLSELQGAVFSITNAGSYGALMGTPILNPPQSGILGMYTIQERPVARDGQVVIRPMMYLALSYDHRVVDGKEAGTFLKSVAEGVETPARFLLGLD